MMRSNFSIGVDDHHPVMNSFEPMHEAFLPVQALSNTLPSFYNTYLS